MSVLREHFATLARYHWWATQRLYVHVDALSLNDYRRDCGLFFASVHGTLNHLLVADELLWYPRFVESRSPKIALDTEAEPERAPLRERLLNAAARWQPAVAAFDDARFAGTLDYRSTKGLSQSLPFAATLAHVFNHGTHHRGQITSALTAMGQTCPEIDLVWMLQAESRPAQGLRPS